MSRKSINADEYKDLLKYGMQGQTTVITGKTTFFEYYKNKLLDK